MSILSARTFLTLAAFGAVVASAPRARADILPSNSCSGTTPGPGMDSYVGDPCDSAGPGFDEPGICVAATCQLGGTNSFDGGNQYPCSLCQIPDGGLDATAPPQSDAAAPQQSDAATPQQGDAAAPLPALGEPSIAPTSSNSSGGCSTSPLHRDGAVGGAMLGLGVAALAWSRRKNRR